MLFFFLTFTSVSFISKLE